MPRLTERKSSKPRIPEASVSGNTPKLAPSPQGWTKIEKAFGRGLSSPDRSEICAIVDKFFDWRRFETAAPLVEHVTSHIEAVEKAARGLNRALLGLTDGNGPDPEAGYGAKMAIEKAWPGSGGVASGQLRPLILSGHCLALACKHAREVVEGGGIQWQGQAWDLMIRRLAGFASRRGMPITARKDPTKQIEVRQSRFVVFVKAIQDQFPEEVPIRFSTADSLATAISGLRRHLTERGIDFELDPPNQIPPAD